MRRLFPFAALISSFTLSACGGGKLSGKDVPARDYPEARSGGTEVKTEKGESKEVVVRNEVQERQGKVLGVDPEGCTWLEGTASVAAGVQDTHHQTRAAAMDHARAAAIQDFLGVEVKSRLMDFQQEGLRHEARLTEGILQTTRNGRIMKEQVLDEDYKDAPDCPNCLFRMRLKACVVPRDSGADKDFAVELGVSSERYRNGEEAKITVTATRDCWIYLYNIYDLGLKDRTALVVPNENVKEKRLKAGVTWKYPDEEAKKLGVRLIAELPQASDDVSAETIRVIASKAALSSNITSPAVGGWLGVLRRLNHTNVEWTDDVKAYTILKR